MHDSHHMTFRGIGSKNQLGEFPVAVLRDPGSHGCATVLVDLSTTGKCRRLWSVGPLYTLKGRQNQVFTAEMDGAGWFASLRLVSRF
jgi:hypothetical protein